MDLEAPKLVPPDHKERLRVVIDESWKVFQSHFINEKHPILKEAPFQHHFANILATVGSLYCISREDRFLVDLEAKCQLGSKSKFLDITCSFTNVPARAAIELKFKTAQQGAQDHGRIDAYCDIAALEKACGGGFDLGRFYMITDSSVYINQSRRGVGTVFPTHHGHQVEAGKKLVSTSKGREGVEFQLDGLYQFQWKKLGKWYFLEIQIENL